LVISYGGLSKFESIISFIQKKVDATNRLSDPLGNKKISMFKFFTFKRSGLASGPF